MDVYSIYIYMYMCVYISSILKSSYRQIQQMLAESLNLTSLLGEFCASRTNSVCAVRVLFVPWCFALM